MHDFISGLFFYVFAFVTLLSGIMVVTAKNSVHSVLFLILSFFGAAGLFILIGAEFVAMTLVIVYVGAVAVLFLFVVMMLKINIEQIKSVALKNLQISIGISLVLIMDLLFIIFSSLEHISMPNISTFEKQVSNTHKIGQVLYTDYIYLFEISGLILLVAMIGAIVLTLRDNNKSRRTKITRDVNSSIQIVKVPTGVGIDGINN